MVILLPLLAASASLPVRLGPQAASVADAASGPSCPGLGGDWSVKVGADSEAYQVDQNSAPTPTSIAQMTSLPLPNPLVHRSPPTEKTIYTLSVTISKIYPEHDLDTHMAANDGSPNASTTPGHFMILELPDDTCVPSSSPFAARIANAHKQLAAWQSSHPLPATVQVTGVGFFDHSTGQADQAPNQIELHPILDFNSTPGATPPPPGAISGQVTSAGGGPIAGASVSDGLDSAVKTDSGGNYNIANVLAGQYTVTASAPGFTSKSQSAAVSSGSTSTANFALSTFSKAVAAIGADKALWVNRLGWTSLGGTLLAAPAVVSVPNGNNPAPLLVALGGDHDLWVRTLTTNWQRLNNSPGVYCIDSPGAAVISGTLYVACMGGDQRLWLNSGPVSPGVSPTFNRNAWQLLGGAMAAGPAVASVPGRGLDIMVVGPDHALSEYYGGAFHGTGFRCSGHPAMATDPAATTTYFACGGEDRALWMSQTNGSGWFGTASLGGIVVDGPGIAVNGLGPTFYVEGADRGVWERSLSASGWTSDGGIVNYGVGAASY